VEAIMERPELEARVREALSDKAVRAPVSPHAWAKVDRAIRRQRPWRRGALIAAACLLGAALVAVPLIWPVFPARQSPVRPAPTVPPASSTTTTPPDPKAGTGLSGVELAGDPVAAARRFGVSTDGRPVAALSWEDRKGRNLVVLSSRDEQGQPDPSTIPASPTRSARLWADHFTNRNGATGRLRMVRDYELDCPSDLTAEFRPRSLRVTDLDGDGIGEVLFAYTLQCSSDVSPATFKLLLLEDGRKYIIRGQTWLDRLATDGRLGEGVPEPSYRDWPAPLRHQAQSLYDAWVIRG
jgi:hypothetical protein